MRSSPFFGTEVLVAKNGTTKRKRGETMATVKKEGKGEVKEAMEKRTPEELDIMDRFDTEYSVAGALLAGIVGMMTSELYEPTPSVEILAYEIEDHLKEIKKIFYEVTGQNKTGALKEIGGNINAIQNFTLSHTLKKKARKKLNEVISMIDSEKKRQKIA